MFGLAYGRAAVLKSVTCSMGNKANGSKAVTATGTASVAHQIAINKVMAATAQPIGERDSGLGDKSTPKKTIKPIQKPLFLYACIILTLHKTFQLHKAPFVLYYRGLLLWELQPFPI